jgi:RNA polymerase sigma-70 factor, ECF subfamily
MTVSRSHLQPVSPSGEAEVRALLDGVTRGERAAIGAFFDRFEADVNRLVWSILGADASHDDVVNEAFETMLKKVADLRQVSALRAWVRKVTVNTVRMELRRRRWNQLFSRTPEEALDYPDLRAPSEVELERTRALYRALAKLSANERSVIVLRHLEGLELTEVADSVGLSLATLKRHLTRAEARLGALLGRNDA